jgi:putative copper export protein/mono/diheme cytochrome c family protein
MLVPQVDLQGGPWLAAARFASVTALLSAFGTITFRTLVAPKAFARMPQETAGKLKRRLLWLAQLSIGAGLLGTFAWLYVQSAYMADADSVAETFSAIRPVFLKTVFGHVVGLQFLALLVLAAVLGWRDSTLRQRIALGIGVVTVALQAGHSHAESMYQRPSVLLGADIVHLLGAGAWLGGLVPLLMVVQAAPAKAGATAARWFSPLGQWCIGALALSALFQGWVLVASIPGLIGTAYGWLVIVKILLFVVLLGFACANRYKFAPALLDDDPVTARRTLLRSMFLQTGCAVAIIVAAVVLSELPPAMHLQALWPFRERISLEAVREDPDFLREVLLAGAAWGAAIVALAVALVMRRFRIPAAVLAALVGWFAVPHFDPLLADAYPTSFFHSTTGFSSDTIVSGASLYAQNCVACHGPDGAGDGTLARSLPVAPANLLAGHLWMHSDGELFWWLTDGIISPEGQKVMPGFADVLDEDQRWAVIDYIRAHNAGHAFSETGSWPQALKAPGLNAKCGARSLTLFQMRGKFVRLVIGALPAGPAPGGDLVTIVTQAGAGGGVCVAQDESVPAAYSIVSGIAPASLQGTQFLIDAEGWLRAVQRPGGGAGWDEPTLLSAEIMSLKMHPVSQQTGMSDQMKMPM